jgi:type II secretion system protein J
MYFKVVIDRKRMHWNGKAGVGGFTLLEVLVSMSILAVVIVAVYEAFVSNVGSVKAARQGEQVNQTARIVLEHLSQDLVSAVVTSPQKPDNVKLGMVCEDKEEEGHTVDRIDFTSFSHVNGLGNGPTTDLCEIGYSLEKDPDQKGFILYRRDAAPPDDDLLNGGRKFQLARNVEALNFRFENTEEEDMDAWDTLAGEMKGELPSLVTIELTVLDDEGHGHVFVTSIHPALSPAGGVE